MQSYINLDKNLIVNRTIGDAEIMWHNVRDNPFSLHGLYEPHTTPAFIRVPEDVATATSEKVGKISCKDKRRASSSHPAKSTRTVTKVIILF